MTNSRRFSTGIFWVLAFLAMSCWGGNWTASKLLTPFGPPSLFIFWRLLATTLFYIPVLLILKPRITYTIRQWQTIVAVSLLYVAYYWAYFGGLQTGLAGTGGIVVTTLAPLLVFLFSLATSPGRLPASKWIGLLLGVCGGIIFLQPWQLSVSFLTQNGLFFFLGGAVIWALVTWVTDLGHVGSPLLFSFWVAFLSLMEFSLMYLPFHYSEAAGALRFGWGFWGPIVFLGTFGTVFASTAYVYAIVRLGREKAASLNFLVPGNAVFWSWVFLKEMPHLSTLIGAAVGLIGVYLIAKNPKGLSQGPAVLRVSE